MSDEKELRAALELAHGKVKELEAKSRDQADELRVLRARVASSELHSAQLKEEQRAKLEQEVESIREQLASSQKELAIAQQNLMRTWKRLTTLELRDARRPAEGSAGRFAIFGATLLISGGWLLSRGLDGATCLAAIGVFFALPWWLRKMFDLV